MRTALPAISIISLALLMIPAAQAQDALKLRLETSPRHREWVDVEHGDRTVPCFIVYPEVKDKAPAVVVIHEIFGLTDWVRGVADQLAEAGYIAIAPNLLAGTAIPEPTLTRSSDRGDVDRAIKLISKLPPDQVTADLNATADYVAKLPSCNGKIAVAGFCWGGGQSFRFATDRPNLAAAFVFYGTPPDGKEAIERIACPVYGFYAGNDARIDTTIPQTEQQMKAAGKKYAPVTYDGAGHGFMRAGEAADASPQNRKARDAAWDRWKELLKSM